MSDQKRPYTKRRRAELEEQTRLRLTESAMELHGTVGPSRTSVSAVAEHAGVRRSTLYRHFPDEAALFAACSGHWMQRNPPPDIEAWARIPDRPERLAVGLRELYAYYGRNEQMLANLLRDETTVPVLGELMAGFHGFVAAMRDVLVADLAVRGAAGRRLRAAVGHAVAFTTWRSLVRDQGLTDAEAVELMCRAVAAAGQA